MTLSIDRLRQHYARLKQNHEAAERQVSHDEAVLRESTKNLNRIGGSLATVRLLMVEADSMKPTDDVPGKSGTLLRRIKTSDAKHR